MSKKVYEIAKELEMESKELLEKLNAMGVEAKSHNSTISDIDAKAVENMILHNRKKAAETKIVKATPSKTRKKTEKEKEKEIKISVKPAAIVSAIIKEKVETKVKTDTKIKAETKPSAKPVTPLQGVPLPKSATKQPPQGIPMPKSASMQPPGVPVPKSATKQPLKEEKVKEEKDKVELKQQEAIKETPQKLTEPKIDKEKEEAIKKEKTKANKIEPNKVIKKEEEKQERPTKKKNQLTSTKKKINSQKEDEAIKDKKTEKVKEQVVVKEETKTKTKKATKVINKTPMNKTTHKKTHKQKIQKPEEIDNKINLEELDPGTKIVNVPITVKGLSEQIEKSTSDLIMALMKLGIMANINQNLDEDTVVLLGEELGITIVVDKVEDETVEEGLETFKDSEEDLRPRPPIITVMGHVDHGKTSLLDAIRKTSVTSTESGGITQHIGASEVTINDQKIVFLDTPGHEAFTTMRARGAHVTDIAVLVVAADDSVKPQTIESISHAKAAGVPIIVAINKMDKPSANPDRVKQDLTEHGVLVEEWGGDTICVPVSAKTGDGIVNLLEMILLQAEILELKANPNRLAMGTVIEARLDKSKGPVATLLVLNGTLQSGMSIVAGTSSGRIRAMTNYKGGKIRKAGPATAVEIIGLTEVPEAGDQFHAVKEDRAAREIAEQRKLKLREEVMVKNSSLTLEQLFNHIQDGEIKELNLVIKADVQGSVGALIQSLEKLQTENVKVKIIHSGVGTVTESDIMLASTSNAIIIGFNIRPNSNITALAERENVEIRTYRVIYDIIDDIESALKGLLDPVYKEVILGKVEIRNTFKVPGIGIIGGAYVIEGKVQRNAEVRLVRDGIVIHEGKISSLKRFKDDAKEVAQGYECGIGIENFNDIKVGDIIEVFKMEEIARK
ncbi:MAG: translation initiation factor IF-2 [Anaerovoracaceae bacterium]|jgi:translation initiation factor IF-2